MENAAYQPNITSMMQTPNASLFDISHLVTDDPRINSSWDNDYEYYDSSTASRSSTYQDLEQNNDTPGPVGHSMIHPFRGFPVRIPAGHWATASDVTSVQHSVPYNLSTIIAIVIVAVLYIFAIALLVGAHCRRDFISTIFDDNKDDCSREALISQDNASLHESGPDKKTLTALQRISVVLRAATNKNKNIRTLVPTEVI